MKQFTTLYTGLIVLLLISAAFETTAPAENASFSPVYDSTGAMLEAINPKRAEAAAPLVYDATGAMLEAIHPRKAEVQIIAVYDATGAMLEAINPKQA
jgi:hypothetical protein